MMRNLPKSFKIHLAFFISAHVLFYIALQSEPSAPSWLSGLMEAARSGKMGFYHEPTGIYINGIWTLILAIDAWFALSGKKEDHAGISLSSGREMNTNAAAPSSKRSGGSGGASTNPDRHINPWLYMIMGGALEIVWAFLLKMNMLGGPLLIIFYFSFYCLTRAAKTLPISTVAAAFAGFGAAGTGVMDMLFFERELNLVRIGLIALLIVFIFVLKLGSDRKEAG